MNASLWLAAAIACAQFGGMTPPRAAGPEPEPPGPVEDVPSPPTSASKIVAVTVYQGQALVTREVAVPAGEGVVEVVVSPLPRSTVENSLYAEGGDGVRVLSARFRTRAVREDRRREVREREERIRKLGLEAQRIQKEIEVGEANLRTLGKLESFTGATLSSLTEKGRLESGEILALSRFVFENRGEMARSEVDLRQRLQAGAEAAEFAKRELAGLSSGAARVERDAVIVVRKSRPEAGSIRLGHLVGDATWRPQYRLRGAADDAPVRLEYLAAVSQQTGEDWPSARVTLSTARPTQDAAPPDLLPLRMDMSGVEPGPVEGADDRSQKVANELGKALEMSFKVDTPLSDVIDYVRKGTSGAAFRDGIPIYVDPQGLQDADKTLASTVSIDLHNIPLRTSLRLLLRQINLTYVIRDGLLTITSAGSGIDEADPSQGGPGSSREQALGVAMLNRDAANDQTAEMRVGDDPAADAPGGERDGPSVSFAVAGELGIPSRRDPQLLEIGRVELPAEYYAKAVPVLTPRVYRLAKLTNKSDLVLLPGEATAYVGGEFVGKMRLPLVAAGEPFVAGFGVDPQLQVARRLLKKTRTVQGGNQVFAYEFRIGLRNLRPGPVKVQLWDRLPTAEGEAVAVHLVKTSADLSTDALYQRTARNDNLLRWDVEVPPGTVGDKTMYLTYEFRLEYARDLPQPRFLSGGLAEAPIGGSAMGGGMGGMGGGMGAGGFRSIGPGAR